MNLIAGKGALEMKVLHIAALAALLISAMAVGVAADTCYPRQDTTVCGNCPAPAYDRTPYCVEVDPPCRTCPPSPRQYVQVDPWVNCGAFCAAGQLPTGWPYGWHDQYWLRPDSNF